MKVDWSEAQYYLSASLREKLAISHPSDLAEYQALWREITDAASNRLDNTDAYERLRRLCARLKSREAYHKKKAKKEFDADPANAYLVRVEHAQKSVKDAETALANARHRLHLAETALENYENTKHLPPPPQKSLSELLALLKRS